MKQLCLVSAVILEWRFDSDIFISAFLDRVIFTGTYCVYIQNLKKYLLREERGGKETERERVFLLF